MEMQEVKQPELKDLLLAIKRYLVVNPDSHFVYAFVTPVKGEEGDIVDADMLKSSLGSFGHIEEIRQSLEILRTMAEEETDEEGYVNVQE